MTLPSQQIVPGKKASSIPVAPLLLLTLACAALFRLNLQRLWQWTNPSSGDPNWGHAIFIPLISLAYLLEHRDRIRQTHIRSSPIGLAIVILGIAIFTYGIIMGSTFAQFGPYVQDLGMLVTLFGCVWAVFGRSMILATLFALTYLLLALPWPPYIHDALTIPLQKLAATASVVVLRVAGLNVSQAGNTIHILSASGADRALNVAEACSGMRSLITFIAVGLAIAFLSSRRMWQKIIISLSAIPIAIACNIFRISGQGLLDHYVSRRLSEGFAHSAVGFVLLAPGLLLFLLVGKALTWLSADEPSPESPASPGAPRPRPIVTAETSVQLPIDRGKVSRGIYLTVLSILIVSAVALSVTSRVLQLHFQKIAVPLTMSLAELPADLGPWHQYGGNHAVPDDILESLGTSHYIFRDYVDERLVSHQELESLQHRDGATGSAPPIAGQFPGEAVVRLGVTYYTGRVDAVIHQSERCNVAAGVATSVQSEPATWDLAGRPVAVRVVKLINESPAARSPGYVAYCYRVNGHEETEAWRVRSILMNIFEPEAWFAKIEVTTPVADANESARVLSDFLTHALPEIEKCLPTSQNKWAAK